MTSILLYTRPACLILLSLLTIAIEPSRCQELIESFDVRRHTLPVKLWQDDGHYKTIRAIPLSIERKLHSFWGNMLLASDGCIYLPPATHSDFGASIWLVRYNPATCRMEMVFEARTQFGRQIGFDGLWDSKNHTGILPGKNGRVYFAGMIGGSYATMYTHMVHPSGFMGGHIYQHNTHTGQTIDLGIPHRYTSLIAADIDLERNIMYLLSWPKSEFLIFPIDTRVVRNLGTVAHHPEGAQGWPKEWRRAQWGRDVFVYHDHTVWTNNSFGCFVKYDPQIDDLVDTQIALPQNGAMRAHVMGRGATQGKVYGTTNVGWMFEFDPSQEKVVELGSVSPEGPFYSPSLTITPDGRSLYYIAGTHGNEPEDGMHIMRYDILERKRVDCGYLGRQSAPPTIYFCYGAAVHQGLVYFNVHGGRPSNSYLLVYDPQDAQVKEAKQEESGG